MYWLQRNQLSGIILPTCGSYFFCDFLLNFPMVSLPAAKKKKIEAGKKHTQPYTRTHTHKQTHTSAPCICRWLDKSPTPTEKEDTEVVATARGPLSGFAGRNLKHLNLFDHTLTLEGVIHSVLTWHLSAGERLARTRSSPGRPNGRGTYRFSSHFASTWSRQPFISVLAAKTLEDGGMLLLVSKHHSRKLASTQITLSQGKVAFTGHPNSHVNTGCSSNLPLCSIASPQAGRRSRKQQDSLHKAGHHFNESQISRFKKKKRGNREKQL